MLREEINKNGTAFGDELQFGCLLAEWQVRSWVLAIKWSPSGKQLAWVSHDSTVHFLDCPTKDEHKLQSVPYNYLPFRDLVWVNENSIIAVGHDANPIHFTKYASTWKYESWKYEFSWKLDRCLDPKKHKKHSAANIWHAISSKLEGDYDDKRDTIHQNCITYYIISLVLFGLIGM